MLFNEPKLLKCIRIDSAHKPLLGVSVLFNEPKLLKFFGCTDNGDPATVSVLFNEPKLLKLYALC